MADIANRLERIGEPLRRFGQWWLAVDFRRWQLPILVLALAVWAITARSAWQSQESATPLLRERISRIREARAHAEGGNSAIATSVPSSAAATPARTTAADTSVTKAVPSPATVPPRPAAGLERAVQRENRSLSRLLAASIESWLMPEPASREAVEGNPHTRVWVDLKTGLYYCPGAYRFGYGGAARGRVMIQKQAEYEYFQSATGAPCQ